MSTPCGILGCPFLYNDTQNRPPIVVAYENDFGVATEQQIKVCDDHFFMVTQVTQAGQRMQQTAQSIVDQALGRG